MKAALCFGVFILIASCGQSDDSIEKVVVKSRDSSLVEEEGRQKELDTLVDKTVKFLWRGDKYDSADKRSYDMIFINEQYCDTITEWERAALGYVATFVGNECEWDGEYTRERSNLKCMVLSALGLGYQCSERHLGFLRKMFKRDSAVMVELKSENCPQILSGATFQNTFDEITLMVKGNAITVVFEASGNFFREGKAWSWKEVDHFLVENESVRLVKKAVSKVKRWRFRQEG